MLVCLTNRALSNSLQAKTSDILKDTNNQILRF